MKRRVHTRSVFDIATGRLLKDEWVMHEGLWVKAGAMAAWDQDSYAFYVDDGEEASSTQTGTTNTETTLNVDTTYHGRVLIQETGGADGTLMTPEWEYNHESGGWTNITTSSSVVKAVNSIYLVHEMNSTQRIGSGTFISPNSWVTEDGGMLSLDFLSGEECEGVLAFQIVGADVSHGDEILLRMYNMDSYTRNADIDVNKPTTRRIFVVD